MDALDILEALRRNRTIDITTTGAKSGRLRRIETSAWPDGGRSARGGRVLVGWPR